MMTDTPCITHATGRDDDFGPRIVVDGDGILRGHGQLQSVEPDRVLASMKNFKSFFIEIGFVHVSEDGRGFLSQGTVQKHRCVVVTADQAPGFDFSNTV